MAKDRLLIYGANGYVGTAASRLAVQQGLAPVVAGRNEGEILSLAASLGVDARVFALDDGSAIDVSLRDVHVVLHLAGPYAHTSQPMIDACLRTGTHYLDITGETAVLEALAARHDEAMLNEVMIMPAVGLDSVPSDCLAAHLKRRLPSASRLALGLSLEGPAGLPPGTQRTMLELASKPDRALIGAEVSEARGGASARTIDFGRGTVTAVRFQGPDAYIASHTTGIANIETYIALPLWLRSGYRLLRYLRPLLQSAWVRSGLERFIRPGPTAEALAKTRTRVWAEAKDDAGEVAVARLHGPEGALVWTTRSALVIARKVLAGQVIPGFQTPAGAYGADLALEAEGVSREDVR